MKRVFFSNRTPAERRALTLIELVVVMAVLAAVAGIVLPLLPNMVTRAHTSTSATNLGEVGKAVQTHEAVYMSYPTNFDSLVTTSGSLASYVPGSSGFDLQTLTPSAETVDSLQNSGLVSMLQMADSGTGDFNPTFYPYGNDATIAPTPTTISTSTPLAALTGTAAARMFALPVNGEYVVFGLGNRTTMQGRTLQEAPVHYPDHPGDSPENVYARYGLVFQTVTTTTTGTAHLDRARMVGIVAFHDDGLEGLNGHLSEYWKTAK